MLIEIAIGDAYGAGFEYAPEEFVRKRNDLSAYVQHPRHSLAPGSYTDDTQMSLAIAEAIADGAPWTREELAERFVRCFRRDPREGYAARFYDFLLSVRDGADFLARIKPNSDKSGAAMRAVPVGVFADIEEVKRRSALQAAITHDTKDGVNAAVAASLMGHYFLYRLGPKAELGRFLESHVPGRWAQAWSGKVGEKGWMAVRAAVTAVTVSGSMTELLRNCVALTGDVDTVAAIALGAVAGSNEVARDLPSHLFERLENGPYGRLYLEALDDRLTGRIGEGTV